MRNRLIELMMAMNTTPELTCPRYNTDETCKGCQYEKDDNCDFDTREADYLIDNGVIVPPCKVGTKVFYVNEVCDENANEYLDISVGEVVSFSIQAEGLWAYCRYNDGLTYWHIVDEDFDKTVFLTKEEAEQALKGGVQE